MELKIYDKANNLRLTASPNSSSSVTEEIGGECSVSASFTHTGYVPLDVDDYIEVEGVRYKVKSRYRPKQKNTQTYEYSVKFYAPIHDAEDTLMLFQEGGTTSEFSYDGGPREHLQLWIDNMNRRAGGNLWSIGTVITAENKVIDYRNVKCWDAAFGSNGIAATFDTEMWADGYVINLCKAERGEVVELGYLQGLTNLAQEDNGEVKFFTRLFPLGSTRNIDATKYGYSRLQLPSREIYVDKNVDLYGVKEETEETAFAEIYPQYVGTVSSVRTEEKISEEGRKYTVYYFKDNGMNWNPKDYEIPDLDYMLKFQTGELAGRGTDGSFQAAWHEDTREWEIINIYPDDTTQIPGDVIIPNTGDKYIPLNFAMPQEYITEAEQAYKLAVDDFLNTYSFDPNKYTGTTDRNYIEKNNTPLRIGWNVRLLSEQYFGSTGGYKDTRITKVQRKLNDLCQATITCSDEVGSGWKSSVDNSLNSLRYEVVRQSEEKQIDVLKTSDTKTPSDYNVFSALKSLKTLLRKDQNDSTNYLLSLLGGAKIGKNLTFGEFITNVSGGMIDEKGIAELESLFLRSELIVPAIRYNFMTYFMGYNIISPGGGLKVKDFTDNGDGTWTVVPDLDEGIPCGQYVDDILTGFWYDKNADSGDFAGFRKMQFRVMSVDYDAKTFVMAPRPDTESVPYKELKLGQTGNFTNENRQTYIVIDTRDGSNCITLFEHANTWDPEPAQMPAWFGKKRGMTVQGINADNYSAVLQNIIMTGLIYQIDEITGDTVRVPLWKGDWVKGKYGYYNEVSHNGSRYLCVNPDGTEQEPGTGSDWLVTVQKGEDGKDGEALNPRGRWEASQVPYYKNDLVSFTYGSFVALRETNEPPYPIAKYKNGNYRRKKDGGYILAGASKNMTLNPDWQMVTAPDTNASFWLDCPVSTIGISSVGTPSPSSVLVTCKMGIRGNVQLCSLYYLAARKYNGSWIAHVSPVKSFELSVPATAGYTQFAVRAYRTAADANAWNDNYVCEKGIGVSTDGTNGKDGADAAFLYDNGPWKSGTTYVWNDTRRDKVIHTFNNVYYNFLVKNKGASVTVAPSSPNGDSNWEAMNKLINIATDSLFADGANVANFLFKNGVLRSQDETDGVANIIMNGKTGYFHCSDADITGKIKATSGYFQNGTISNCVFNSLKSSDNSFVYDSSGLKISAAFSISANGFTLKMEKESADFVIQNANGQNLVRLAAFSDIPTVASPTLVLSHPNSGNGADLNATSLYLGNPNGEQVGLTTTSFGFRSNGKNYDGKTTYITVYDSNGNGSRMYFYNGILYDVKSV